ncbi:PAS domain S-box-containing protein [Pseudomonas nitritireducens]|uniref:PAS domain S-box-containing protein n=1 Tax=Pseudomonas nitroreducens TaxID=46680 RepID=A0A7W7P0P2_PSENT|nr:PAS domain S-box-containing protein [Pseudomonas nitritireducens]
MNPRLSALRISLLYLVVATLWVWLSDQWLQNVLLEPASLTRALELKRFGFLAVTSLLLFFLLWRHFRRQLAAYEALADNEQRLSRVFEVVEDGIWDWDLQTHRVYYSPGYANLIGLPLEHLSDDLLLWENRLHPDDRARTLAQHQDCIQGLSPRLECVYRIRHGDGGYRWVRSSGRLTRADDGQPLRLTGVNRDITRQRSNEDHLRQAAAVFEATQEGLLVTDASGIIVHTNPSFSRITGYSAADVLGGEPSLLKSGRQDAAFYQRMWSALLSDGVWSGEIWNRRKSGEVYPQWQHIRAVRNEEGELTHYVAVFSDLSSLKRSQHELDFLAHHDPLTGLPNRLLLRERIEQALTRAEREQGGGALLSIDLDHFKHINDSLGHSIGDLLIRAVAERLEDCLDERCSLARLGGDEFAVVLESQQPHHASSLAQPKFFNDGGIFDKIYQAQ